MTNEQLAELIQGGCNEELLPLLWDNMRFLLYKKCGQFWKFYSEKLTLYGYDFDDLYQESYNALLFAVKQYKSEKGYKFTSYLNYALKLVVRDILSGSDVLSRSDTQSLEQPLAENKDGEPFLIGDIVPDRSAAAVFEKIERLDEYRPLYNAIDCLTYIKRRIIIEYYFKGLTFKQIGKRHNISAERVRQLHNKAIQELKSGETGAKLRSIYGVEYRARYNKPEPRTISNHKK